MSSSPRLWGELQPSLSTILSLATLAVPPWRFRNLLQCRNHGTTMLTEKWQPSEAPGRFRSVKYLHVSHFGMNLERRAVCKFNFMYFVLPLCFCRQQNIELFFVETWSESQGRCVSDLSGMGFLWMHLFLTIPVFLRPYQCLSLFELREIFVLLRNVYFLHFWCN